MLGVRFCQLFQLNSQEIYRSMMYEYFKEKVLYNSVRFKVDSKVLALRDKLIYCDYLDQERIRLGYLKLQQLRRENYTLEKKQEYERLRYAPAFSVTLKNEAEQIPNQEFLQEKEQHDASINTGKQKPLYMPYAKTDSYKIIDDRKVDNSEEENLICLNEEYEHLYQMYFEAKKKGWNDKNQINKGDNTQNDLDGTLPVGELWKIPPNWMTDYEQFDDTLIDTVSFKIYGTPVPTSEVSSVACGGCGALLHCKDPAIPGYLPSELFLHTKELKLTICQRCHFLKIYNASLKVKVSIEDYPKLLRVIKDKKCAIILIVDLTDFPCSIWPDLKSVMHPFTPIFLVGSKVDLLPKDCPLFSQNVEKLLLDTVVDVTGVNKTNIRHVQLISAKTGYGIEELINKLQKHWKHKGDVYLIGCTNVGKSTLFNTLLNSDYCKVQAVDLVQRATVSPWPGTTLNLLKFPILNPTGVKLAMRAKRLISEQQDKQQLLKYRNERLKHTRNIKYATLIGHVGRTFAQKSSSNVDPFAEMSHKYMLNKPILDESRNEYQSSRWCYDTPGTMQTEQILDLLTTDELVLTLPETTISPRTFDLKPKQTVFVAGIGRLDYLEGDCLIRCTLFMSNKLPLTICYTVDADDLYNQLLKTEAFVVPNNDSERLKVWPKLASKEMTITGIKQKSAADVVLSNAGWIAITPHENENAILRAWTPEGRGIYLRSPALLSYSVRLRGWKIPNTPLYSLGRKACAK